MYLSVTFILSDVSDARSGLLHVAPFANVSLEDLLLSVPCRRSLKTRTPYREFFVRNEHICFCARAASALNNLGTSEI